MIFSRLPRLIRLPLATLLVSLASTTTPARAEDPPKSLTGGYSPYEKAAIDEAVATLATRADSEPEGKVVEGIDVVTLDVIEPRDPAPGFLNGFHATTRHYVIEREVLLLPGERFRAVLCDETARNLRQLP